MQKKRLFYCCFAFATIFILGELAGIQPVSSAQKWQAFEFRGDEHFEYQVSWEMEEEQKAAVYILDIRKISEQTPQGEALFEVSYTTRGTLRKEELGPEAAFGLWSVYGISLNILVLNPAYGYFFAQMNMNVGEMMTFDGAGAVKISGKEAIAGREGFICQFLQTVGNEEELVSEWVIDPDIALPLRSKVFEAGELVSQIELLRYVRY